jgi:hypothetical protein
MALKIIRRCNRCLKPMRNDGTEESPKWVCNNPKCVKYKPPTDGTNADNEDE